MISIYAIDHAERHGTWQSPGPVIYPWICQPEEEPGQPYADFRALYSVWKRRPSEIVGFMGYRKYMLFDPFILENITLERIDRWWRIPRVEFDVYRDGLSKWDGQSLLPLLATHDIIVTPPWPLARALPILHDFGMSRSWNDAAALGRALDKRGIEKVSERIYPYIFVTRWSVFNRFMEFAWPLAQELEPLCKGDDSCNYAYKRRPMAYVLERAFSLWLENSGLSWIELPLVTCWEL
jgi:hypothetical protein